MKLSAAVVAAAVASVASFAPKGSQVRNNRSQLNNWSVSKWSPGPSTGGYSAAPVEVAPPAPVAASGPPKSYSVSKWSPNGANGANGAAYSTPVAPEPTAKQLHSHATVRSFYASCRRRPGRVPDRRNRACRRRRGVFRTQHLLVGLCESS